MQTKNTPWTSPSLAEKSRDLTGRKIWTGKTIADYAAEARSENPDRPVIVADGRTHTISDLIDRATALARGLMELGLKPGDTISLQLPNWIEAAEIDLAAVMGGFVMNPIVSIYRGFELRSILNDCHSRLIFSPGIYRATDHLEVLREIREAVPGLDHVVPVRSPGSAGPGYEDIIALGRASNATLQAAHPDDVKQIVYTSGTTGHAKGVIWTHNQARRTLANSEAAFGLKPGATFLIGTPVGHVSGLSYGIDNCFYLGTQTILMERWDADDAVKLIDSLGAQVMVGATPFLAGLLEAAERAGSTLPSLEVFFCGGAAVPPDLIRRANRVFRNCRTFRVFGSTECPMITQGCPEDPELSATTDGRIYDYEVKVVDDAGRIVAPGLDGEILARGPAMFMGYTDPVATAEAFDDEGFFRTGDIGRVTADGVLTVTGRKKDLIIRGGENLSPKEIEDALHTHPDIREVAITSMPHARLGEGVYAFIIPASERRPDQGALAEHLRSMGLAAQKWPERIEYVDDLPRTPSGKVQKHILRARIVEEFARQAGGQG